MAAVTPFVFPRLCGIPFSTFQFQFANRCPVYNYYFVHSRNHHPKNEILAAGTALLFGYFLSYLIIIAIDTFGCLSDGRSDGGRRMRDFVTRHLYVFGIGCMLSVCPLSGLHGAFHAVFAWITVLIILGMYILNFIPIQDFEGKIRNTGLILYYLSCFVWYVGITAYFFKARS